MGPTWMLGEQCLCHTTLWRVSSLCLHVTHEKPELQGDEILPDTSCVCGGDQVKLWSRVLAPEPLLPSAMLFLNYNPTWQPCITLQWSQISANTGVLCGVQRPGPWGCNGLFRPSDLRVPPVGIIRGSSSSRGWSSDPLVISLHLKLCSQSYSSFADLVQKGTRFSPIIYRVFIYCFQTVCV